MSIKLFKLSAVLIPVVFLEFGLGYSVETSLGKLLGLSIVGNKTSETGVIKLSSGLNEGMEVSAEDVQKAVKQLWALGIFSDIRVVLDHQTSEGVFLTVQVKEFPRLERTEISGNKKLKNDEIEKELSLFRGQVVNPSQISKAQKQLNKMYGEKGYTLAKIQITPEETDKDNRVILRLKVDEGRKVQIKRIQFFGNSALNNKKLRKQMKDTKQNGFLRGGDFDKEKYESDKEKVLEFYRNNGYRDAEILKDSLYYDPNKKDLYIDITLIEATKYYFGSVSFQGNALFTEKQIRSMIEFTEGDPFSQEKLEKTVGEKIGGAYSDLGYISAQINPVETLSGGDTLNYRFVIQEGLPYSIRKIRITGNTRTKERVIRREIRSRPGDVFSKELLVRSARELMMLNYFSNVVPDGTPVGENQMDLSFKVEEKSTDTANLSAGYSELYKLIGSVGLGMNNLFGNGQRLSLDWNFGQSYRSFNIGFTEPWFLNTPTMIGFDIFDTKSDAYYLPYSQRSRGLSFRFGRRFSWPDSYFRGDWIYKIDEIELGHFEEYFKQTNPGIANEKYPLTSSGITQIISRNSLDQPEFPTQGSSVSLETEIAGGPFGGNVGYHKYTFSAEYFMPTITRKLILLARAQVGFMDKLTKTSRIPYTEYFFMGGSGLSRSIPLRGYDDPLAGGGYSSYDYVYSDEYGGKTMFKTTAELRFPIIPNPTMYGLIFAEAGNTWKDLAHTDVFELRRSLGVGARIFMPMIGMIGFDYAYGFDHYDQYGVKIGQWKPHFVFGRSF